jgi:hypothetical protein
MSTGLVAHFGPDERGPGGVVDDEHDADAAADEGWATAETAERAVLSDSPEGREIAAAFIAAFGEFVSESVRPVLRDLDAAGGQPQALVNGLAQLMRDVADSMELPLGAPRPRSGDAAPGVGH